MRSSRYFVRNLSLVLFVAPSTQETPHGHELAQVICIVVGDQQSLTKDCLPVAVRERSKQIRLGVGDQIHHGLQISPERGDRLVPCFRSWWGIALRPVTVGEIGRDVMRIDAELKDVPLGDSHVLDQPPRREWQAWRLGSAELNWHASGRLLEIEMGVTASEQFQQMISQCIDRSSLGFSWNGINDPSEPGARMPIILNAAVQYE